MHALSYCISITMAAVLFWAGLTKLQNIKRTAAVFSSFEFSLGKSYFFTILLIVLELASALGLVFVPHSGLVQLGVFALATVFAVAGFWALHTDRKIQCSCLGLSNYGLLGWNQLIAYIPWLGGISAVHFFPPRIYEFNLFNIGSVKLVIIILFLTGIQAAVLWKMTRLARADRICAEEMFGWRR